MGIRKRMNDDCLISTQPSPFSSHSHSCLSKRPRFSSPTRPALALSSSSNNAAVARLSRYPILKQPLRRVHAPCKPEKFSSFSSSSSTSISSQSDVTAPMGNALDLLPRYFQAKEVALATCRKRRTKEDEEDSSVEEVVVLDEDDDRDRRPREPHVQEIEEAKTTTTTTAAVSSVASDFTTVTTTNTNSKKVESPPEKMLEQLSLDCGDDLPSYKKLLEKLERERTPTLNNLSFEIRVNEEKRILFELLRPKKKLVEKVPQEPFIPLTDEDKANVERAFASANRRKVLVTHENSNIQITGELLQCLKPCAWLNDEVINVYLELLKERENRDPKKFLKCHFFNTFFYKKLIGGRSGYDYKAVRRWTTQKKLGYGLIDCDKIFVPIHKEIHWCLAVINKVDQKIQYLDSLKGMDTKVMKVLAKYYVDEVKDKSGKDIDMNSWEFECVEGLPEQENGFDCGVFMIKYADFYSRGLELCFHQKHMPYFRLRTAKEVLQLRAD